MVIFILLVVQPAYLAGLIVNALKIGCVVLSTVAVTFAPF